MFRTRVSALVRMKGLEPSRVAPLAPKASVSTIPPHPHAVFMTKMIIPSTAAIGQTRYCWPYIKIKLFRNYTDLIVELGRNLGLYRRRFCAGRVRFLRVLMMRIYWYGRRLGCHRQPRKERGVRQYQARAWHRGDRR
jgi:hypothetical protein